MNTPMLVIVFWSHLLNCLDILLKLLDNSYGKANSDQHIILYLCDLLYFRLQVTI